jgi:predicted N-acetyltransferase YhbS
MILRDFDPSDAEAVDALGLAAFEQYADKYEDWAGFSAKISHMSSMAETGEIVVASLGAGIVGAVAYFGPQAPKSHFFAPGWAIMRMLVVSPSAQGQGIGRALAQACISKARRDHAPAMALHTSAIMAIALPMYLKMGFKFSSEAPPIHGVPYGVYVMPLTCPA